MQAESCEELVSVYENLPNLIGSVTHFISQGLIAGEGVIVIPTIGHWVAFAENLDKNGINVSNFLRRGQLVVVEVEKCLSSFMVNGKPDWNRFKETLESVLRHVRVKVPQGRIRAYGELVDILWKFDDKTGATQLARFWNEFAKIQNFSIFSD